MSDNDIDCVGIADMDTDQDDDVRTLDYSLSKLCEHINRRSP